MKEARDLFRLFWLGCFPDEEKFICCALASFFETPRNLSYLLNQMPEFKDDQRDWHELKVRIIRDAIWCARYWKSYGIQVLAFGYLWEQVISSDSEIAEKYQKVLGEYISPAEVDSILLHEAEELKPAVSF